MSAPIVACGIADAIGALLPMLNESMGCHSTVEHFNNNDRQWFVIYLHDHDRAFSGSGETLCRALMEANENRQTYQENMAKELAA